MPGNAASKECLAVEDRGKRPFLALLGMTNLGGMEPLLDENTQAYVGGWWLRFRFALTGSLGASLRFGTAQFSPVLLLVIGDCAFYKGLEYLGSSIARSSVNHESRCWFYRKSIMVCH
jgi:hypothetical protein